MSTSKEICFSVEGHLFVFKIEVLCEASPYFHALLNGNFCESRQNFIYLEEIDAKLFAIICRWITFKQIHIRNLSNEDLLQLMFLVDRFLIDQMVILCNQEFLRRLQRKPKPMHITEFSTKPVESDETKYFYQFFEAAVLIENKKLKNICVAWLMNLSFNFLLFYNQEDWTTMSRKKNDLEVFMQSEEFNKILENLSESAADVMYDMVYERVVALFRNVQIILDDREHQKSIKELAWIREMNERQQVASRFLEEDARERQLRRNE